MGKTSINGPFSMAMLNNQMVIDAICLNIILVIFGVNLGTSKWGWIIFHASKARNLTTEVSPSRPVLLAKGGRTLNRKDHGGTLWLCQNSY